MPALIWINCGLPAASRRLSRNAYCRHNHVCQQRQAKAHCKDAAEPRDKFGRCRIATRFMAVVYERLVLCGQPDMGAEMDLLHGPLHPTTQGTDLDRLLMPPRYRTVAYKIHVESAIAAERRRCKVAPPIARHQPTMERATEESSTRCEPMFDRCKTLSQPRCFDLAKPLVAPANYPTRTFQKFGAGIALV